MNTTTHIQHVNFYGDIHIHIHLDEQKEALKSELKTMLEKIMTTSPSQDSERKTPPKFYRHS